MNGHAFYWDKGTVILKDMGFFFGNPKLEMPSRYPVENEIGRKEKCLKLKQDITAEYINIEVILR